MDVSIGFHSGSGKSAENYRLCGEITGSMLEIKTSGRYTYELGKALCHSGNARDQALWRDWYAFTVDLSVASAFSENETERAMARSFIQRTFDDAGGDSSIHGASSAANVAGIVASGGNPFASEDACRAAIATLGGGARGVGCDHMLWFEYNFLFVLAAGGRADKAALGDHSAAGYRQRARVYGISDEARLLFAKGIASYIIFLADTTGLGDKARCKAATAKLGGYTAYAQLLADISG